MGPLTILGMVGMFRFGAAFAVPPTSAFLAPPNIPVVKPQAVVMESIESSVESLMNVSSSVAGDVTRIKSMLEENQETAPDQKVNVYNVTIHTGDVYNAGTDGDVVVQLIGEHGESKEQHPDSPMNDFERGNADSYIMLLAPLGTLTGVKVRCSEDNEWFLNKIVVNRVNFLKMHTFPYNDWVNGTILIKEATGVLATLQPEKHKQQTRKNSIYSLKGFFTL